MNYTENYHLPQWVKSDRIMMEDFNRMCADIESGLTGNAQAAQDACQSTGALDEKTWNRLRRLAYNHYSAVQDMDPFPWQMGMFHQNPARDGSNVTGTGLWNGVCFAGKGPVGTSPGSLSQYAQVISPLKIVKNNPGACEPMTVSVCIPGNAWMSRIDLGGSVANNTPNAPVPARLSLINQDTGEIELIQSINLAQSIAQGGVVNDFIDVFLPFHGGQHYLLKLEALSAAYDGELTLLFSPHTPLYAAYHDKPVSALHTIREEGGSSGGLVIVRGLVFGPEGKLTVSWDGKEVPLHTTRMVQIPDGRLVREMVCWRNEFIPAETTLSLRFDAGGYGSFLFYDWGAVLL